MWRIDFAQEEVGDVEEAIESAVRIFVADRNESRGYSSRKTDGVFDVRICFHAGLRLCLVVPSAIESLEGERRVRRHIRSIKFKEFRKVSLVRKNIFETSDAKAIRFLCRGGGRDTVEVLDARWSDDAAKDGGARHREKERPWVVVTCDILYDRAGDRRGDDRKMRRGLLESMNENTRISA